MSWLLTTYDFAWIFFFLLEVLIAAKMVVLWLPSASYPHHFYLYVVASFAEVLLSAAGVAE